LIYQFAIDQNKFLVYPILIALVIAIAYVVHQLVAIRWATFWHRAFALTVSQMIDVVKEKLRSALP
jgi:hypothetical protein